METLKRSIEIYPAFDKRNSDPSKNYGIHGVNMTFLVTGEKGAIQFVIYTNWHLPHVKEELIHKCNPYKNGYDFCSLEPMPADIGYHSPVPMYEGQTVMSDKCEHVPGGGPCYYDGSSLGAQAYFDVMVSQGHEALWKKMEECYEDRFGAPSLARSGATIGQQRPITQLEKAQ